MKLSAKFDRRSFLGSLAAASAFCVAPNPLLRSLLGIREARASERSKRLSWLAHRGTEFEGAWNPSNIEGDLPLDLVGTLYRIGPGSKNTQGTPLHHFFDGDSLMTSLNIKDGRISALSRFVNTAERQSEIKAQQMLYDDYGTASPEHPKGYKYSPNIHLLPWAGKMLALSESSHPTALDPETLDTIGSWNFEGSLPFNVSFTAHPKFDPRTGDTYTYGISKSLEPALKIYRMDKLTEKLVEIHSISLGGFFPIHDMMMTENYLVFVVPPLKIDLLQAALTSAPIAEILKYDSSQPLRIITARKDGSGTPAVIESAPSGMVFHHFNAYEDASTGNIVFHSLLMDDDSAFPLFQAWSSDTLPPAPKSWLTRFEIDLTRNAVVSRKAVNDGTPTDFPCIDGEKIGTDLKIVHALENQGQKKDALAFDTLARWDLHDHSSYRISANDSQMFGEPVLSAKARYLMHLGYDSNRDESFLDIRDPLTLELASRVWLGRYLPLGFHGAFIQS